VFSAKLILIRQIFGTETPVFPVFYINSPAKCEIQIIKDENSGLEPLRETEYTKLNEEI